LQEIKKLGEDKDFIEPAKPPTRKTLQTYQKPKQRYEIPRPTSAAERVNQSVSIMTINEFDTRAERELRADKADKADIDPLNLDSQKLINRGFEALSIDIAQKEDTVQVNSSKRNLQIKPIDQQIHIPLSVTARHLKRNQRNIVRRLTHLPSRGAANNQRKRSK
jgi:hypothetical protein